MKHNIVFLNEIVDSGGIVALDTKIPSHRMAYVSGYDVWERETLADKYGLDTVQIYPYYCLDKYYMHTLFDNIFIDETNYKDDNDVFGKYVRLIVRVESEYLQEQNNHITFTIDYTRPKKWYKSWMDKWRNYQYDRTVVVERDKPDVCFDGYCYYMIWFGKENVKGLKSIKYEIE